MARKIGVRIILEELLQGKSQNSIASDWHISKHSVGDVAARGIELKILPNGSIPDIDDDSLYKLFFPKKITSDEIHESVMYMHPCTTFRTDSIFF